MNLGVANSYDLAPARDRLYNARFARQPRPVLKHTHSASLTLVSHPQTPNTAVHSLTVGVRMSETGLALHFVLMGDIAALRIPPPSPRRAADELWRHTCFEAFVAGDGERYHEFNFSPSGELAAYAFRSYRERGAPLPQIDPRITVRADAQRLEVEATIAAELLPACSTVQRLGLCAVIEDRTGALSYWALKHAPGKPDFHHRDSFVVELQ